MGRGLINRDRTTNIHKASNRVLIVGEDIVAYNTAKALAGLGYEVSLVMNDDKVDPLLYDNVNLSVEALKKEKGIDVYNSSRIEDCQGFVGDYQIIVSSNNEKTLIDAGCIVITTGYSWDIPDEFCDWLKHDEVCSIDDLDIDMGLEREDPVSFVVPPEISTYDYYKVLKSASKILDNGDIDIFIFCQDVRVSDYDLERVYSELRKKGVIFIKYGNELPLFDKIQGEDGVLIKVSDSALDSVFTEKVIQCQKIVLASQIVPGPEIMRLSNVFEINLDSDGFFQDENIYQFPFQSNRTGIFIAGLNRGDRGNLWVLEDASGVTGDISGLISHETISIDWITSDIDTEKCALCLTCLRSCPAKAIYVNHEKESAEVVKPACQGCGICTSVCPARAIDLEDYSNNAISSKVI